VKILLLGRTGQIGHELQETLESLGTVVAPEREVADLTDPASLRQAVADVDPDGIVNAAAYTAVDRAEEEPERARKINAEAPAVLAEEAARRDAWLVHYSTDYVFDGTADRPYREDDPANPLAVYGRTKWEGEEAIRDSGARHLILRTSWVYSARRSNFLLTMLRLAEEVEQGERDGLTVVDDQIGCPTSAPWIAEATATLLERFAGREARDLSGTYHLVSGGQTSWYGFARAIFGQFGYDDVPVEPVTTDAYPTKAERPAYSVLDTTRIRDAFGLDIPTWTEQLDDVRRQMRAVESPTADR
jgi:dTDP-4-dehydrorhamnose reductase